MLFIRHETRGDHKRNCCCTLLRLMNIFIFSGVKLMNKTDSFYSVFIEDTSKTHLRFSAFSLSDIIMLYIWATHRLYTLGVHHQQTDLFEFIQHIYYHTVLCLYPLSRSSFSGGLAPFCTSLYFHSLHTGPIEPKCTRICLNQSVKTS